MLVRKPEKSLIQDENSEFQRIEVDADQVELSPDKQPTCYAKITIGKTDLMIRYPIDGLIDSKPVKILPKVENQIWFGSEEDQNTDVLTTWFWTKFLNTSVKAEFYIGALYFQGYTMEMKGPQKL